MRDEDVLTACAVHARLDARLALSIWTNSSLPSGATNPPNASFCPLGQCAVALRRWLTCTAAEAECSVVFRTWPQ